MLSRLNVQIGIKEIKDFFEITLAKSLNLQRVSAPLFVQSGLGVNDDLNGKEPPLRFKVKHDGCDVEIIQSLAKWKRLKLAEYGMKENSGIYADMNAIRPNETLDSLHSIYVDQWDWEKVIYSKDRNLEKLKSSVKKIYDVICRTEYHVASLFSNIRPLLPKKITFISTEELFQEYKNLTPREREIEICRKHKAVFIIGIGYPLGDNKPHDERAPDYDDWISLRPDGGRGLNGDLFLWHPIVNEPIEISSMGIRVNKESLHNQLEFTGQALRKDFPFHKALIKGYLPDTIGGGIGQSRLCMYFLRSKHIGEVAEGYWPKEIIEDCLKNNINLLTKSNTFVMKN